MINYYIVALSWNKMYKDPANPTLYFQTFKVHEGGDITHVYKFFEMNNLHIDNWKVYVFTTAQEADSIKQTFCNKAEEILKLNEVNHAK